MSSQGKFTFAISSPDEFLVSSPVLVHAPCTVTTFLSYCSSSPLWWYLIKSWPKHFLFVYSQYLVHPSSSLLRCPLWYHCILSSRPLCCHWNDSISLPLAYCTPPNYTFSSFPRTSNQRSSAAGGAALVFLANVNSRSLCRRPSVCLSVCVFLTFVHPTQAIEIFGNVYM